MLTRVRQLEKKLMISQGRVPSVQEILSRFSSRLSEVRDFLLSAASTVQEAEDRNRASLLKFQRKEVISPALCSWNHTLLLLFDQNALVESIPHDPAVRKGSNTKPLQVASADSYLDFGLGHMFVQSGPHGFKR